MNRCIRIGTRESELATWQAKQVATLLAASGYESELVFIKSEGDIDLKTPLYEMGVQGIFTRSLDVALLAAGGQAAAGEVAFLRRMIAAPRPARRVFSRASGSTGAGYHPFAAFSFSAYSFFVRSSNFAP